jgi:hypothetical protein
VFSVRGDGQVESSGGMVLIGRAAAVGPPTVPSHSSLSLRSRDVDQTDALASSGSGKGAPVEPNVVLTVFEGTGAGACTLCACFNKRLVLSVLFNLQGALIIFRVSRADRATME